MKLKFRAWHKHQGWIKGLFINDEGLICSWNYEENDITALVKDCVIVELFTGLLDKNRKEIFEGDIVKFTIRDTNPKFNITEHISTCVVEWDKYNPCFVLKRIHKVRGNSFDFEYDFIKGDFAVIEIVGNIHENPELLKGEENGS